MIRRDKGTRGVADIKAFLGEGTEFKGVLSFQGTIRVDGRVEGEVLGEEMLIVGEDGVIQAEVEVGSLIASGRIEGNIRAKRRVELLASSRVVGNIVTPCLIVMEGATLDASCDMDDSDRSQSLAPVDAATGV